MDVLWLGECPEPGCTLPYELIRTDCWDSTCGPVQTRRTRCLAGHVRDSHPVPVPLGRDMPCPRCPCGTHRFTPCECGCPAHDLTDDVEP